MRIDGTSDIQRRSIQDNMAPASGARAEAVVPMEQGQVQVQQDCAAYIQKAGQVEDVNLQAVAEAKRLMQTGQLDTPEALLRAANNMLTLKL